MSDTVPIDLREAAEHGYLDGLYEHPKHNPYEAGTREYAQYEASYAEGVKDLHESWARWEEEVWRDGRV